MRYWKVAGNGFPVEARTGKMDLARHPTTNEPVKLREPIAFIGYDPHRFVMHVIWQHELAPGHEPLEPKIYEYRPVFAPTFISLITAESVEDYFSNYISTRFLSHVPNDRYESSSGKNICKPLPMSAELKQFFLDRK